VDADARDKQEQHDSENPFGIGITAFVIADRLSGLGSSMVSAASRPALVVVRVWANPFRSFPEAPGYQAGEPEQPQRTENPPSRAALAIRVPWSAVFFVGINGHI